MNRAELAKILATEAGLSKTKAESLIMAFGDTITEALQRNEKIVYSNFGTFYKVHYPSKIIYHPKLGAAKKMIMLPTDAVKWMPAFNIKEMVKTEHFVENPTMHGSVRKKEPVIRQTAEQPIAENNTAPNSSEEIQIIPIKINNADKTNTAINPVKIEKGNLDETGKERADIYEEFLKDGGKEEATFDGVIRLHDRPKSLLGRIFGKKEELPPQSTSPVPQAPKVSLIDSGIFSKSSGLNVPNQPMPVEAKTETIRPEVKKTTSVEEIYPTPLKQKEDQEIKKEIDITPFENEKVDISYADLSNATIPKETLQLIPEKIARKYKVAPVENKSDVLVVAMIDPGDVEAKEIIKRYVQKNILPQLTSEGDLSHILDQYQGLESEVEEAIETVNEERQTESALLDDKGETKNEVDSSTNAPVVRIVTSLIRRAIRDKASDIHVEPAEKEVEIRFRQDGILKKKISLPKNIQSAVISRIKIMSNMKIDEQRLPQDGRFSVMIDDRRVDFRVSSMPVAYGEKIVIRVLDKLSGIVKIDQLGIRGSGFEKLKESLEKSHGMILVTGPTGSGKTTTLYALIDRLFNEGVNIITLEDPIEYQITGINQSQVNADINYTFANGLRSILRQDPDIVMIGEIRDGETAEMAVHAALTGHIVLSTLHTNNAAGAIPRMIDMGVEPFLLNSSINLIIAQRLARKICQSCKEEVIIDEDEKKKVISEIDKMASTEKAKIDMNNIKFYRGKGCKDCNDTGYKGRIGIYEVLPVSEEISQMITDHEETGKIHEKAIGLGMMSMFQDGILKTLSGETSLEEVLRVTKD